MSESETLVAFDMTKQGKWGLWSIDSATVDGVVVVQEVPSGETTKWVVSPYKVYVTPPAPALPCVLLSDDFAASGDGAQFGFKLFRTDPTVLESINKSSLKESLKHLIKQWRQLKSGNILR